MAAQFEMVTAADAQLLPGNPGQVLLLEKLCFVWVHSRSIV